MLLPTGNGVQERVFHGIAIFHQFHVYKNVISAFVWLGRKRLGVSIRGITDILDRKGVDPPNVLAKGIKKREEVACVGDHGKIGIIILEELLPARFDMEMFRKFQKRTVRKWLGKIRTETKHRFLSYLRKTEEKIPVLKRVAGSVEYILLQTGRQIVGQVAGTDAEKHMKFRICGIGI